MEGNIGSATWDDCKTCKRWNNGEGCDVPEDEFSVHYDKIYDCFICESYEPDKN